MKTHAIILAAIVAAVAISACTKEAPNPLAWWKEEAYKSGEDR